MFVCVSGAKSFRWCLRLHDYIETNFVPDGFFLLQLTICLTI